MLNRKPGKVRKAGIRYRSAALILSTAFLIHGCRPVFQSTAVISLKTDSRQVQTGLDLLAASDFSLIRGRDLGLVINHTSVTSDGRHILDVLHDAEDVHVKTVFTPEHGLKGQAANGEWIEYDSVLNGIQLVSLYGKSRLPDSELIKSLDLVIFDIQDVGSRYYTYVSTLTNVMQTAAETGTPVLVLDRPNPLGGLAVRGPVMQDEYQSFVGMHPVPIVHGLTMGEYALMINELQWLNNGVQAELGIATMQNWHREIIFPDIGTKWIPPSPNIPDFETAFLYQGLCLLEWTNLSEGRGTDQPFKIFGAPWVIPEVILANLPPDCTRGMQLEPISFTPVSKPGKAAAPKFENEICHGLKMQITNFNSADPLCFTISLLKIVAAKFPGNYEVLPSRYIDNLYGSSKLRRFLKINDSRLDLADSWQSDETAFVRQREPFLLYK